MLRRRDPWDHEFRDNGRRREGMSVLTAVMGFEDVAHILAVVKDVGRARSGIGTCLTEEELLEHLVEDFWVLML